MTDSGAAQILVVEDNKKLSYINCRALESEGYEVRTAFSLAEAREALKSTIPDVILLDVKLPDGNGFDLCREIRETTGAYIIFLTSIQESSGELEGLASGGDDYLRKPYDIELLRERVKKGLRHARKPAKQIQLGTLALDIIASRADINGDDLLLSPKEFDLLLFFVQNENRAMNAEYIYERVWKRPMAGDDNAFKNMVKKLRQKLADYEYAIVTTRGEGYCFKKESVKTPARK